MVKLSVIIVSYNTKELLQQCLESFYDSKTKHIQTIVVDNNSSDDSVAFVKKNYPHINLIANKKNAGFSKANNQGIIQSKGEYILLLNSDTIASLAALDDLITWMDQNPTVGIAAPQVLNSDKTIQANGGNLPNLVNVASLMLFLDDLPLIGSLFPSFQLTSDQTYKTSHPMGWVSGAAMCLRKKCLDQIGLLDEEIFMYAEDTDLCLRAWKHKWPVWTLEKPQIIHLAHGSGAKKNAIVGEFKGLVYLFKKHRPAWQKPLLHLLLRTGARLRMVLFGKILRDSNRYEIYKETLTVVR